MLKKERKAESGPAALLLLCSVFFTSICFSAAESPPAFIDGEVIVKFKPNISQTGKRAVYGAVSAVSSSAAVKSEYELMKLPQGESVESAISKLAQRTEIEYVQPNFAYGDPSVSIKSTVNKAAPSTNDTYYALQKQYLDLMKVRDAWDITTGDSSVVVALVGSGIAHNHPDLGGGIGPGYRVIGGYDFINDNPLPEDVYGSGTVSASIIGAIANNSAGALGVMWNVRFLDCKVFHNEQRIANSFSVASGILYAIKQSANIIQLNTVQLQSETDNIVLDALSQARAMGMPVITRAGNDSAETVNYPCFYGNTICVGATNLAGNPDAVGSNKGGQVIVSAPAVGVAAYIGDTYGLFNSGIISAAYVTGLCGLLQALRYRLSPDTLEEVLRSTADDVWVVGLDSGTGSGQVNYLKAVQKVQNMYAPEALESTVPMPNPFIIGRVPYVTFSIPDGLSSAGMSVQITDLSGMKVRSLSGTNKWDGKNDNGQGVASGIYFYKMSCDAGESSGRLTLVR